MSIYDAVKQFDLSRSAFYKYRETIFPVDDKMLDHREFTLISLYVTDIVGMLARVLDVISKLELSVLTIHQSIPMEEVTITLSLNAKSKETSVEDVIGALRNLDYVSKSRIN